MRHPTLTVVLAKAATSARLLREQWVHFDVLWGQYIAILHQLQTPWGQGERCSAVAQRSALDLADYTEAILSSSIRLVLETCC